MMKFWNQLSRTIASFAISIFVLAACTPTAESADATNTSTPTHAVVDSTPTTNAGPDLVAFPVTIDNCGLVITYEQPPERVVSLSSNATWVLLALGLEEKIVGISGIGRNPVPPEYADIFAQLNIITDGNPSHEVVVGADPDFVYSSTRGNFREEYAGTREALQALGIHSYLAREYCLEDQEAKVVGVDDIYADIRNIGQIFGVAARAEEVIAGMQAILDEVATRTASIPTPVSVFYFDSGEGTPVTAGGAGMANTLIELAGGANILADFPDEYGDTTWELVIERNPEVIIIADYGATSAEQKRDFLLSYPPIQDVTAIKEERFVIIPLSYTIAGLQNATAVQLLAEAFYPELFATTNEPATSDMAKKTVYPLTIQNGENTLVFEQAPTRAVSLNLHTTELMLELGLVDQMVGTAYANAVLLPEYEELYAQVPVIAEAYPSLEVLASVEPDFTYGRSSAYNANGVAPYGDLLAIGINPYTVQGTLVEAGTLADVYTDILNLGQIFDIQPSAEALVESIQQDIAATQAIIGDVDEPVRVLVYDAGTDDLFTAGQSLQTHLIALAGGKNIFDDIEENWVTVSWEEAVARDPQVIVINDYGATPLADKIAFLENNPALSSIEAVQQKRFVAIPLPTVFEGVRNASAVRILAKGFYPEKFN